MGLFKDVSRKVFGTPEQRAKRKKEKAEINRVYRKEFLKEQKKQTKIKARRDAKKTAFGPGVIDRLGGGISAFSSGLDNLTKLDDGPFNFSGSQLQPKKKTKKNKSRKPKRKEVYYY